MSEKRFVIVRHAKCGYVKRCDVTTAAGAALYRKLCAQKAECPKCKQRTVMSSRWVEGKLSGRKCDERCTSATGADCHCSCGGLNHGADHDGAEEEVIDL